MSTAAPSGSRAANVARTAAPVAGQNNTLWVVGGVILVGVMLVALYPIFSPQSKNLVPPQQAAGGDASSIDLTTMTSREAADRLWTRVMTAISAGNTQEVVNFLPMAIGAYELAEPLDLDGKYHVSMLKLEGQDNDGALAAAEEGLELYADHILNLGAAGDAAMALGDTVTARTYYQHMMDVWDVEVASGRQEYELHKGIQAVLRRSAEALLGG